MQDADIALDMCVNFHTRQVVCKAMVNGIPAPDVYGKIFPFHHSVPFDIIIITTPESFKVCVALVCVALVAVRGKMQIPPATEEGQPSWGESRGVGKACSNLGRETSVSLLPSCSSITVTAAKDPKVWGLSRRQDLVYVS